MRTLYLILLFLWLFIGYFICNKYICNNSGPAEIAGVAGVAGGDGDCNSTLIFRDASTSLDLVSDENFRFEDSADSFLAVGDEFNVTLGTIVSHLGENPNILMQIKGYHLPNETNGTSYENLGLARANMVKAYFLEQGVNSDQLRTIGKEGNSNCMVEGVLEKGVAIAFGPANK
jgi:outer membrane protein OmpA-like peptidoglycan-associated protein